MSGLVFTITEMVVHPHPDDLGLTRGLQGRPLADHDASPDATQAAQTYAPVGDAFL